jgi:DNA replication licensing factor MCM7
LEDFLRTFKSTPASALTKALNGMTVEEDGLSDEYDFMDDEDEGGENARRQAKQDANRPTLKYMDLLGKVSNRYENEITIELDDLAIVNILALEANLQTY